MEQSLTKTAFLDELDRVLHHLYDPGTLGESPLIQLFGIDQWADAIFELQHILTDAIESLRPDSSVPPGSGAWRVYHTLYYRYTEQATQREVAAELGLSTRQLRRQEKAAIQVLADYLWSAYNLAHQARPAQATAEDADQSARLEQGTSSRQQELAWLEKTLPAESVHLHEMLAAILPVIRPLMQQLGVSVTHTIPDDLPPLAVQQVSLRQALLYILTVATRCVPGGQIRIQMHSLPRRSYARIQIGALRAGPGPAQLTAAENLDVARELVQISGGTLKITADSDAPVPFAATIVLPTAEQICVLVIDDNIDTLYLVERYLAGTRYHFVGASDPHQALAQVEEIEPDIIVLDVMLPDIDGWELLGRLREHPGSRDIPVIICTILPQEQLAQTLGAADFIRKPVHRQALLSALGRQTAHLGTRDRSTP
jgi:CheY-like chemotaxis protein